MFWGRRGGSFEFAREQHHRPYGNGHASNGLGVAPRFPRRTRALRTSTCRFRCWGAPTAQQVATGLPTPFRPALMPESDDEELLKLTLFGETAEICAFGFRAGFAANAVVSVTTARKRRIWYLTGGRPRAFRLGVRCAPVPLRFGYRSGPAQQTARFRRTDRSRYREVAWSVPADLPGGRRARFSAWTSVPRRSASVSIAVAGSRSRRPVRVERSRR